MSIRQKRLLDCLCKTFSSVNGANSTLCLLARRAVQAFQVVLGRAYRGLTGGFLLLRNFSVAISVSPHVCFILVLILISMFLR